MGRWSGTLAAGGEELAVAPDAWWGARDHSWGVRPVGGGQAGGAPPRDGPRGFFWSWAPIQFDDGAIMYTVSEDHDGSRWHEAAARLHRYEAERPPEGLAVIRHDLRLKSGTRIFDGGTVLFAAPDGRELTLALEPLSLLHMAGAGYAYGGDLWRHAQYHGELAVEGETWDLKDAGLIARVAGQNETVCRATLNGDTGYGILEFILFGLYEPYGFKTLSDVAP